MKTQKAYALFIKKEDGLHALYIKDDVPCQINEWYEAKEDAKKWTNPKNGRDYVWGGKLGWLAWRPGKHLATLPLFDHIGPIKMKDGKRIHVRYPDSVICEVEYSADKDWKLECEERSRNLHNGKLNRRDACLNHLPYEGYYFYQTNTQAKVDWIICHKFKINRILLEEEVVEICEANGIKAQILL